MLFSQISHESTGAHTPGVTKNGSHMKEIKYSLGPHINMSVSRYAVESKKKYESAWGTVIEILVAPSLLDSDIYSFI